MADHQQSPEAAVGAAAASPPEQIAMAFIDEILVELQDAPAVQHEFVRLLSGFKKHGDDAVAVSSRAADLLSGHPDVLRRFTARIYMDVPAEAEQILAVTRPRRRTSRPRRQQQTPPAAHVAAAAARRNDGNDGGGGPRRSSSKDAALAFVKRVHDTAGPVIHARFLAVLSEAKGSEDMAADEIYDRFKQAFGRAHVGLLHAFATVWLPGEHEWKLQQQQQARRVVAARHRSPAAAAAATSHAGVTDAKKKPSAGDDGNNGRRRQDHVITGVHHGYSGDNDSDKKPPPRRLAAIGGKSSIAGTAAAAGPMKQQPAERDSEVRRFRRFRQEWEFQTNYSKLVATSDRVTELLRRPTRTPHSDGGSGNGGGGNRSLEALFPLPECQEFLHNLYGGRWGEMRAALERGESRVPALEAIERRLTAKEEEAVVEESRQRRRHDPDRVAQRLHGLAMDVDEECRRRRCRNDRAWLANVHDTGRPHDDQRWYM